MMTSCSPEVHSRLDIEVCLLAPGRGGHNKQMRTLSVRMTWRAKSNASWKPYLWSRPTRLVWHGAPFLVKLPFQDFEEIEDTARCSPFQAEQSQYQCSLPARLLTAFWRVLRPRVLRRSWD